MFERCGEMEHLAKINFLVSFAIKHPKHAAFYVRFEKKLSKTIGSGSLTFDVMPFQCALVVSDASADLLHIFLYFSAI
jgi:hypothetical protein